MPSEAPVAIVTGAGSGIGRATALALADRGAHVLCLDLCDPTETVAEVLAGGGAATACQADVSSEGDWGRAVAEASALGRVEILANIAGVMAQGPDTVVDQTFEGWERIMAINLRGTWLGMRAVLPAMIEAGRGQIVNVASGVALVGFANVAAYTASKGAIVALTRQAAVEYAHHGVRINAVAPGWIDTPLSRAGNTPEMATLFAQSIPVRRVGRPEEIAEVIAFLASDSAQYVAGQIYSVDGGLSAGRP